MPSWCRWVDNHLVHVLSPNIYRNTSEALESFDYITNNGKVISENVFLCFCRHCTIKFSFEQWAKSILPCISI